MKTVGFFTLLVGPLSVAWTVFHSPMFQQLYRFVGGFDFILEWALVVYVFIAYVGTVKIIENEKDNN